MDKTASNSRPDVSIVFTNWNTRDLMRECIKSVEEKTEGLTYEIIVVDDGSTDGSVEMLKKEFPEVAIVVNDRNLGVAKAYNRGVAIVKGRYIQMLNTDMIMINNAIKVLVDFLERHPEAAACGGRLRNPDMSSQVSYGSFPSFTEALIGAFFLNNIFPKANLPHRGIAPNENVREAIEVEYLSGADMLIRKEVVDKIGFFDERYTSYCEETDFCYRIRHETPWKLYFVPQAEIIHFGGMSFQHVRQYQLKLMYSSYDKFFRKHHGVLYSLLTRSLYALQHLFRLMYRFLIFLLRRDGVGKQGVIESIWNVRYSLFPQE